jgi:arylsulfatase A-like enzyme
MNKARISLVLVFVSLSASCWTVRQAKAARDRPNIILVMADDMGFSDLGCYGSEIKTPTIDRLAKEGLRFSQFYNCALCGPSRAALMTGLYPYQAGIRDWTGLLNNRCVTAFELLKEAGYATCAVGRLDMITGEDWHDPARVAECTDRFLGVASGGPGNYYKETKGCPWFKDGKKYDRPVGAYSTDLISAFVADFIEASAGSDQPFFIYVSHFAPHWPLQAEEEDIAPYRDLYKKTDRKELMHARLKRLVDSGLIPKGTTLHDSILKAHGKGKGSISAEHRMAIHAAMVESIDRSLADTMAALKKAGKRDNTLILVLSDNGASHQVGYNRPVPPNVRPGSMETFICQGAAVASLNNTPFRNYKVSNYEGGIASPLVAWWPRGLKQQGRISHGPCHIADIMPTCLELAGATYPSKFRGRTLIPLAGKSLVPVLSNTGKETPRTLVWSKAVRDGDWKLILGKKTELYNISQDRNERKNVAAEFPKRVLKLKEIHAKTYSRR